MKLRRIWHVLAILFVTNAVTAFFMARHGSTNGFAEITFKNVSADTIKTAWLEHSSFDLREHEIKRGDQKSIRFYMDERSPDRTCEVVVSFAAGQGQTCNVVIGNGEKRTIYVYQDRIESDILKRAPL